MLLEKQTTQSKRKDWKRRKTVKAVSVTTTDGGLCNNQHKEEGRILIF